MSDFGRVIVILGVLLVVIGGAMSLLGGFRLPGDFTLRAGSATVYIPIATSIVLSILLTVALNLVLRHR